MRLLHEELRAAREKAGLSQQALADRAGIPRNQVVRAERGENITLETLRKLAAYLPVTELPLLDTTGLRVDIFAEPEKLYFAALENVQRVTGAMRAALELAVLARTALEMAHRATAPIPGEEWPPAVPDSLLLLRNLQKLVAEVEVVTRDAKLAS
jgi:transcriptional regulator with XRE-family HTH domain